MEAFVPRPPSITVPTGHLASGTSERIEKTLKSFQDGLKENEEIGACLAQFGQAITISIEGVRYWNPSLVIFDGVTQNGDRCELVQHMSQVNLLLVAVPVEGRPARRIGFTGATPDEK